ncbi:MAG: hypothetical protein LBI03_00150, partial [Clostridiales bacterium]|nr:hypothetical protein [Clostridiales bacterium]
MRTLFKHMGNKIVSVLLATVMLFSLLQTGMLPVFGATNNNVWSFTSNYAEKFEATSITSNTSFIKVSEGVYGLTSTPRATASFMIAKYGDLKAINISNGDPSDPSASTVAIDSLTVGVGQSVRIPGFPIMGAITLSAPMTGSSDPGVITISVNSGYNLANPGMPPYPSFSGMMTAPVTFTLIYPINVSVDQSDNGMASAEQITDGQWQLTAVPDSDFKVDYWASRPERNYSVYTKVPGSEGQASLTVIPTEDTTYICYFKSSIIVPVDATLLDANHIVLTMNYGLLDGPGDPGAFTITGAAVPLTVTAVDVSGLSVTLTLSRPVTSWDVLENVVYTPTGTNDLADDPDSFINAFTMSLSYMNVTFQSDVPGVMFVATDADTGRFESGQSGPSFSYHLLPTLGGIAG